MLALLRAMSTCHARAQRIDTARTVVSMAVAASGLLAAFVSPTGTVVTVVGAIWALLYSTGLASLTGREMHRAATLQEMFDVRLFAIPWNAVVAGEQLSAAEVSYLSKRYRGRDDMVDDYYEIPDLPHPYDVVACQHQNLDWGARVRRRYALAAIATVALWSIAGLVVGAVADLTVSQLVLRWYVPSMGGLMLGLDIYRRQSYVASDRHRVLCLVRERVSVATQRAMTPDRLAELMAFVRQVQDSIYVSRRATPRVPGWFFLRFRETDRSDFRAAM